MSDSMPGPVPLSLSPSFGFGDRLGLATPGHIAAVRGTRFAPIFAQQSVRENARTGRTPRQVLDDASRSVEACGWDVPWGADADHLKTLADLEPFVEAGYTFYTVDPGEHVDNAAATLSEAELSGRVDSLPWDSLETTRADLHQRYGGFIFLPGLSLTFDPLTLLRAAAKYGRAIAHAAQMYRRLVALKGADFDYEISVDETDLPTTPHEHFFIANELHRLGVRFTSLAPRFIGRFEKGVDYIGDLRVFEVEIIEHAAVQRYFGDYKLSLHSGSDKFSIYPALARATGGLLHVKTAGTSYLEGLRILARLEPALFRQIIELALERYPADRVSYHVSADIHEIPSPADLSEDELDSVLDNFHAREALHVTFGSVLGRYGREIRGALIRHEIAYADRLKVHFQKHLELLDR